MAFNVETLVLGAVQGLCEFLPISSSGHLALFQMFFGLDQGGLLSFDVLLHCATMLAVLVFFWKDVVTIAGQWLRGLLFSSERDREGWRMGWFILLSSAVTALVGLPLKGTVERAMTSPLAVGGGLLLTGTILALTPLFADRQGKLSATAAVVVGLAQGAAVLPISRSGATIAAGLLMGLAVGEAFRFSFLISIPAVLGATLLELLNIHRAGTVAALPEGWAWAAAVAFVLGWLSLRLLRCLVLSGRWAYFGFYCLLVGSAAILVALDLF
mgnify:CR=1 FL=1